MLDFDPVAHRYTWMGFEVPSLSRVLELGGVQEDFSAINPEVLERKRQIGTAVHRAIELHLSGEEVSWPDEDSEAACAGYFASFLRALDKLPAPQSAPVLERPIGGFIGYACTPDYHTGELLIEWKTSSRIYPQYWVQLAGQEYAINAGGDPRKRQRYVVQLKPDGRPRIELAKEPLEDDQDFQAVLRLANWKRKNGRDR